tara:strand:+ start:735 stop:2063 length:1329 start_codon:yes stop_codon:yes gene_type:complete
MALINQTQRQYYENGDYGDYQFTSLKDIIDNFIFIHVGEEKLIKKVRRTDVVFHAKRAMQELSFDTFKSSKSQELTVPSELRIKLPQDYVNYVKLSWSDSAGIKHTIYPTKYTSNPERFLQNDNGDFNIEALGTVRDNDAEVPLNDQYDNIVIGMTVSGHGIPAGTTVSAIKTQNNITRITLSNVPVTNLGTALLQTLFFNFDNLYKEPDFKLSQYYAGYDPSLPKQITFYNTDTSSFIDMEDSGVKIGMNVIHEHFPVGTKVVDIVGEAIYVSEEATSSASYTESILFTSDKSTSQTLKSYQSYTPSDNINKYDDGTYDLVVGERYGLNPEQAQVNGTFYISNGYIYFSSNISGKNVIIDYISDGLGTEEEMQVHKLAEEAMYKHIAYAVLAGKANIPEYIVNRFKKEKFATTRQAKLRLSNIKLEEITQVLRNKSKWIKH